MSETAPETGFTRRTIVKGAAWSMPVIAAAVATPLVAATTGADGTIVFDSAEYVFPVNGQLTVLGTAHPSAGASNPSEVELTYPLGFAGPPTATVDPATGRFSVVISAPGDVTNGTLLASSPGFVNGETDLVVLVNVVPAPVAGIVWGENLGNTLYVAGGGNLLRARTPTYLTATETLGATEIVALSGGYRDHSSYLIRSDNTLWSHGAGSNATAPGTTSTNASRFDFGTQLLADENLVDVVGFTGGGYVLTSAGRVFSWGFNTGVGSLGNGTTGPDTRVPKLVAFPTGVFITQISASYTGGIALDSTGKVWAWGVNDQNDTGTLSSGNVSTPKLVVRQDGTPISGVTQVRGRFKGGLALAGGRVLSWGYNSGGQLANGSIGGNRGYADFVQGSDGEPLSGISKLPKFYHEAYHSAALSADGTLYTWGHGNNNVHSPQTTANRALAAPYAGELPTGTISDVSLTFYGIHVLLSDGSVWSWGYNTYGVGADGTSGGNKLNPVRATVDADTPVVAGGLFNSSHGGVIAHV